MVVRFHKRIIVQGSKTSKSFYVPLPMAIAKQLEIVKGTEIAVSLVDDNIVVELVVQNE